MARKSLSHAINFLGFIFILGWVGFQLIDVDVYFKKKGGQDLSPHRPNHVLNNLRRCL